MVWWEISALHLYTVNINDDLLEICNFDMQKIIIHSINIKHSFKKD